MLNRVSHAAEIIVTVQQIIEKNKKRLPNGAQSCIIHSYVCDGADEIYPRALSVGLLIVCLIYL